MEFEIKGVKYRTAKLSVFEQLKVSRKLLPVLAGMEPERLEGPGAIKRLPALIQSKGVEKVLIVTDKGLHDFLFINFDYNAPHSYE